VHSSPGKEKLLIHAHRVVNAEPAGTVGDYVKQSTRDRQVFVEVVHVMHHRAGGQVEAEGGRNAPYSEYQRDPAGLRIAGGTGLALWEAIVGVGTVRSSLGERQLARGRVVIKNLRVAPPLDGGFELAARFILAEMLVEEIAEKFIRERAIGFGFQRLLHLA